MLDSVRIGGDLGVGSILHSEIPFTYCILLFHITGLDLRIELRGLNETSKLHVLPQ
jgi:hypothetical protein